MKNKTKAKKVIRFIILTIFVLFMIAAVYFFQFTESGYTISIPYRPGFQEIEPNVYMNKDNSMTQEEVRAVTAQAKERVTAFFGERHCTNQTIIISDNDKIIKKIGEKDTNTYLFPHPKSYICLSNEYFNVDVVAHELTHTELHSYLSMDTYNKIPTWFDEGLATQNDYRERYSYEKWVEKTDNGKNATPLQDMDSPDEFYCSNDDECQFHYICAKHEIGEWLERHSVQELLKIVEAVNNDEDFYTLYEKTGSPE